MKRRTLIKSVPFLFIDPQATSAAWPGGVKIDLYIDQSITGALHSLIQRWIKKSADAVTLYYGKFPVSDLRLQIDAKTGSGIGGGRTEPDVVPHISIEVGTSSGEKDLLNDDWVLVHEMIHTAIPYVERKNFWLAEGLAVYVESIARVQAGHITTSQIWRDFIHQMPRGIPNANDKGLGFTHDHGRIYWGGALFCLMADIHIRQQTKNKIGLQHGLRAINAVSDFKVENHDLPALLRIADKATGTKVLNTLYDEMVMQPGAPKLDALWRDLGIQEIDDGSISFDATAKLAAIRIAITTKLL
jgi:hypothetical protein